MLSFLASLGLPNDLNPPRIVDVKAVVEQLQCSYPASLNGSQSSKKQQYLRTRSAVDTASYTPDAYLLAVGGGKQRQRMAQLRNGSVQPLLALVEIAAESAGTRHFRSWASREGSSEGLLGFLGPTRTRLATLLAYRELARPQAICMAVIRL